MDKKTGEKIKHDCIEAMKEQVRTNEKKKYEILKQYGMNYDVMNMHCPQGKPLAVNRGLVRKYGDARPQCNKCGTQNLEMYPYFYVCSDLVNCSCNVDICMHCALIECGVLKNEIKLNGH